MFIGSGLTKVFALSAAFICLGVFFPDYSAKAQDQRGVEGGSVNRELLEAEEALLRKLYTSKEEDAEAAEPEAVKRADSPPPSPAESGADEAFERIRGGLMGSDGASRDQKKPLPGNRRTALSRSQPGTPK